MEELYQSVRVYGPCLGEQNFLEYRIGGNVYWTIADNGACVDISQYWKPGDQVVSTTKGICLRLSEYVRLKELLPEIGNV